MDALKDIIAVDVFDGPFIPFIADIADADTTIRISVEISTMVRFEGIFVFMYFHCPSFPLSTTRNQT